MIRKFTLLVLAFVLIHFASFAQHNCGFDLIHQNRMATEPGYAQAQAEFTAGWNAYLDALDKMPQSLKQTLSNGVDTVFEIPVVVHIMHTGGAVGTQYNPSDAMIQAYIDYTNDSWAANWGTYPTSTTGGTVMPFKFVLAKRDTLCNSATGIIRYNANTVGNYAANGVNIPSSTYTAGEDELTIKNLSRWNVSLYYNIWIVNKLNGVDGYSAGSFTAGYAYPPAFVNPQRDGTVLLASRVYTGTGATGGGPGDITLPHELGHAFNLKHVFDPSPAGSGCPSATNCSTTGDECCDTQPILSSNFTCPAPPTTTCTGATYDLTTPHNFMDYSNCQDRFTTQQKLRCLYALKSRIERSPFITSLGATAPPSSALPAGCALVSSNPTNLFNVGPRNIIVSDQVFSGVPDTLMHVTSSGYNGDGNVALVDNTCRHRLTVKAGRAYNIAVNVGNGFNQSRAKVFIDYNNDGVFSTAGGERVLSSTAGNNGGYKTGNFTVPTTNVVYCVPVRMRVIVDGVGNSGNVDSCGNVDNGQAEDYTVMILGTGSSASGSVAINNPPIGGNPSCFGTQLTFWAKAGTGITVSAYRWLVNNVIVSGQTTDTFKTSTLLNNDKVKARILYSTPCGMDSVESTVDTILRAVTVPPTVSIAIKSGTNPGGCVDDTVYYRVSGNSNPGGAPTYQWQQKPPAGSFTNIAGATDTVLKVFGYPAGTQIQVIMTSSAGSPCAIPSTATSPQTTATQLAFSQKAPTVSIALIVGTNPGCAGQSLTFRATPTTGGTAPTYVWRVNGVVQIGVTGNTLTKVFANSDVVNCTLTSNSPCASPTTATSNSITITHTLITADITVTELTVSPSCNGKPATFQATTVNSGTGPLYQWIVNGTFYGTPSGVTTLTLPVVNGDIIKCIFIATDPCVINATDTSADLIVETKPSDTPSVTIKITKGKNPGCIDSLLEFTANPVRAGIGAEVDWMINGFVVLPNSLTFSSTSLLTGDMVQARLRPTDGNCYLPDTAYSAIDTMKRSITLDPPVIHLIGNMIIVDRSGKFVWFGPGGQLAGTGGTYHPTAIGPYYVVADNNGCWSKPSNVLVITLLDISTLDLKDLKVYPNPSNGLVTLDWGGKLVDVNVEVYNTAGQHVMHEEMKNGSVKNINMTHLNNGVYYIVVRDAQGNSGTIKVSVSK